MSLCVPAGPSAVKEHHSCMNILYFPSFSPQHLIISLVTPGTQILPSWNPQFNWNPQFTLPQRHNHLHAIVFLLTIIIIMLQLLILFIFLSITILFVFPSFTSMLHYSIIYYYYILIYTAEVPQYNVASMAIFAFQVIKYLTAHALN